MAPADATTLVDQAARIAGYDALREVASQLAGLLVARERNSVPKRAAVWRQERLTLLARLDQVQPGTPAVSEALQQWGDRLTALRQDTV